MTVTYLILFKVIVLALLGVPVAYLFDPEGWFSILSEVLEEHYIISSYIWSLYAVAIIFILFFALRLNRRLSVYQNKELEYPSRQFFLKIWAAGFAGGVICTAVLLVQNNFALPALSGIGLELLEFQALRGTIQETISVSFYNVGLKVFVSLALVVALFFLKDTKLTILTLILFLVLGTFSLEKATMGDVVFQIMIFYLLYRRPTWKFLVKFGLAIVLVTSLMFTFSGVATDIESFKTNIFVRTIYGQMGALPFYFNFFEDQKSDYFSLLPLYVQTLFGEVEDRPARLIMETFIDPKGVEEGTAFGVASTFFIGDAYAIAGIPGVIIAPFLVVFNFWLTIYLFTKMGKNILNLFFFSYLIDKLQYGLFGSVSAFIFSGFHIMLLIVVLLNYFQIIPTARKHLDLMAETP